MNNPPGQGSGENDPKRVPDPQEMADRTVARTTVSHARRCGIVLLEPRERADFDLEELIRGGTGLRMSLLWIALAPHLDREVEVSAVECNVLGQLRSTDWLPVDALRERFGAATVDRLIDVGLLICDDASGAFWRDRDERLNRTHWHPLSAVAHTFQRWRDVDSSAALDESGMRSFRDLIDKLGEPPPHVLERVSAALRVALPRAPESALSALMQQRTTCRNFDAARPLPLATFAAVLERVFAAQAVHAVTDTAAVLKKNSPSGGGLHPTEAYLLVQHVEGVAPGLYHYHAGAHALEPLPCADAADPAALAALAQRMVAGQTWFANVHVMAVLTPRVYRSFWKYRAHAKGYRALVFDAGHLSQNLYLAAAELGLAAFITSAINEVESERVFGLDHLQETPLAICGFGWRGATRETVEFDPLGRVWGA